MRAQASASFLVVVIGCMRARSRRPLALSGAGEVPRLGELACAYVKFDSMDVAQPAGQVAAGPGGGYASFNVGPHTTPRTRGIKMNSQGDGIAGTGTSISVGPSRRLNARRSAARNCCGLRARSASAPKLRA